MFNQKLSYILILLILSFSISCSKKKVEVPNIKKKSQELEMTIAYKEALDKLEINDTYNAAQKFLEAELLFPQSSWAPQSALMASYSYYMQNYYTEAIQNLKRYLKTYPNDKDLPYAHYLIAMCFYESIEDEKRIMQNNLKKNNGKLSSVVSISQISKAQEIINEIYIDDKIQKYILDLIFASRYPDKYKLEKIKPMISFGASPRGSINLALAAKCNAFINHRGYVIPEDVREVVFDVLRHRIGLTYEAEAENITSEDLIEQIINQVEVP